MILKNKTVAIIGAGPVGLTMAKLLQQKGIDVTVYERDKDAQTRIWGGPLDLHKGSGQDAMKKAGLLEEYYAMAIPMGRTITDELGKIFFSNKPTDEDKYDNPEINRNDLRQLLLNSLIEDTVVWDRKFTGVSAHNGKWLIHFENESDAIADFVIGANGGMSAVRKYVTDAKVEYTGSFIIQGEVTSPDIKLPDFYALCDSNILMTAEGGVTFAANPKNNNALTYGVTFRKPEEWINSNGLNFKSSDSIAAFLSGLVSHWSESYKELFHATSFFAGLPSRKISMDLPWKKNRSLPITLIGDAAHLMPPFAGKGVNTGLMDALLLSDNLTSGKFETIESAINDYEQKMFIYAKEAHSETYSNEMAMHQPDFSFKKRFSN